MGPATKLTKRMGMAGKKPLALWSKNFSLRMAESKAVPSRNKLFGDTALLRFFILLMLGTKCLTITITILKAGEVMFYPLFLVSRMRMAKSITILKAGEVFFYALSLVCRVNG